MSYFLGKLSSKLPLSLPVRPAQGVCMAGYVRPVARAVVLAALVHLVCPLSSALMPLELRKGKMVLGLRLKGGSGFPTASELKEAQETMGNMLQEDLDKLENRTAAERIIALQKKWEERAEYQSVRSIPSLLPPPPPPPHPPRPPPPSPSPPFAPSLSNAKAPLTSAGQIPDAIDPRLFGRWQR
jgi:hypothetical protein